MVAGTKPLPPVRSVAERNALVEQWRWLPRRVLRNFTGSGRVTHQDWGDLEAEGFLALLRAAELWRDDENVLFETYAFNAIRSRLARVLRTSGLIAVPDYVMRDGATDRAARCQMRYRRQARAAHRRMASEARVPDEAHAAELPADDAELCVALDRLPTRVRQILWWRFVDGLPIKAIAGRLGLTKQRTGVLVGRAVLVLRAQYGVSWTVTRHHQLLTN